MTRSEALIARNCYNPDYAGSVAFAAISVPAESYTGDRTAFLGRNRSMKNPAAMERTGFPAGPERGWIRARHCRSIVQLAPGERMEITCMLGQAPSLEEARALVLSYREEPGVEAALERTKAWWDDRLGMIQVHTPELAADFLINRWLLYQALSCRIWGRSAFYQSGGAFGFRDQLQDVMALVYAHPAAGARAHPARRKPSVQGGRRPALVASAGRRRHPLANIR